MRGDSYLDGDEPAAREERPAAAELVGQRVGFEVALVDLPARAVVQDSFLPLDRLDLVVERGVDDDELARYATRLAEKVVAGVFLEVAVEEARQQPFANGSSSASPWTNRPSGTFARASSSIDALWSSPVISPRRCWVRKPVPQATSSVRAGGSSSSVRVRASVSSRQAGRWRPANRPAPSHQSSYSAARRS